MGVSGAGAKVPTETKATLLDFAADSKSGQKAAHNGIQASLEGGVQGTGG